MVLHSPGLSTVSASNQILITCLNLRRTYPPSVDGDSPLELSFPNVTIPAGSRIALLGVSGSGKSTFLNLIAGLDAPDPHPKEPPSIIYTFADGAKADMAARDKPFPRQQLGFVFQEGHLIADASAGINAALPRLLNGIPGADSELQGYMDALELPPGSASREVWRLSGGQKQRVAILRALFHRPQIIFADEPTSNLDKRTAETIMLLLAGYQEQEPCRTLFWATHDLPLAMKFATDFFIVRKPLGEPTQLDGPIPNNDPENLKEIEDKVYRGAVVPDKTVFIIDSLSTRQREGRKVTYIQAKVGSSLTFARRTSAESLAQIGRFGRWMGSIEGSPPPILAAVRKLIPLYRRRFSDHAVAAALGLSILIFALMLAGLRTTALVRNAAMSDPMACHVVAGAPDATAITAKSVELTPSFIKSMNDEAPWRAPEPWIGSWLHRRTGEGKHDNPCGEAQQIVFGRNITTLDLGIERDGQCTAIGYSPKTLVANLAEPAISFGVHVIQSGNSSSHTIAELIPQNGATLQTLSGVSFSGHELLVTEAFQEQVQNGLRALGPIGRDFQRYPSKVDFCIPGHGERPPLHIGGTVSGLPQPRGIPYDALLASGAFLSPGGETYDQAIFYTYPDRAGDLEKYLVQREFAFSREEVQRMLAASQRFTAIDILISIVGISMIIGAIFFLFTCIEAFMEKNARQNAVLRGYGLTRKMLSYQTMWRLGAAFPYSLWILFICVLVLGSTFRIVSPVIGLPFPSLYDVLKVGALSMMFTAVGVFLIVKVSVWLWWRKHGSIAQELN